MRTIKKILAIIGGTIIGLALCLVLALMTIAILVIQIIAHM